MPPGGEDRLHITGVRLRVIGEGDLRMTLASFSNTRTSTLVPLPMLTATDIEQTKLSNFRSQRTRVEISVLEIDEWFEISRLIVFVKPSATSYPM